MALAVALATASVLAVDSPSATLQPSVTATTIPCLATPYSAGIISTLTGSGVAGRTGTGGPATLATISHPGRISRDAADNLYVLDALSGVESSNRVSLINASTGLLTQIHALDGVPVSSSIVFDAGGDFIFGTVIGVARFSVSTGATQAIAGTGEFGSSTNNVLATLSSFRHVTDVALDGDTLFLSDYQQNRVFSMSLSSRLLLFFAGNGQGQYTGDGGSATSAGLFAPTGLLVMPSALYVAEMYNNVVRRIDRRTGIASTLVSNLYYATGISVDRAGNFIITQQEPSVIRSFNEATGLTTIAGTFHVRGFSGDGGSAGQALLNNPYNTIVTSTGDLVFNELISHVIRRVRPNFCTPTPSVTATSSAPPSGTGSSTSSATPSSSATSSGSAMSTASVSPCPAAFRRLVQTDLVGSLANDAPLTMASEGACRVACCTTAGCSGYAFAFTSCALLVNVTSSVHNNFAVSGILHSVTLPSAAATPSPAQTPLAGAGMSRPIGSATPTLSPSAPASPSLILAAVAAPSLSSGLISHITFDGDVIDRVAPQNSLRSTESGRNLVYSTGRFGRALVLDGSFGVISELTSALPSGASSRTFCAWFQYHSNSASSVFEWGGGNPIEGTVSGLFLRPDLNFYYVGGFYADLAFYYPAGFLRLNEWVHIAATYDGTKLELFQNGSLVASGPPTDGRSVRQWTTTSPTTLRLGYGFVGAIDDARIYNKVLSSGELQALLEPGTPSPTPSPSSSPYCAASLFRSLPRMDLVGTLVGTALSPGKRVALVSEHACRQACCDAPACDGFSFASIDASSFASEGLAVSSCFLYVNISQLVPSSVVSSGIYESTL